MEGFIARCTEMGLDDEKTETVFQKYANNRLLITPNIYRAFQAGLNDPDCPLTKAALSKYLGPDVLSELVNCRVKYATGAFPEMMRAQLGLPEPEEGVVEDQHYKIASHLAASAGGMAGGLIHTFSAMPLQQKMLVSALLGGGLGAAKRMIMPSTEDQMNQRGMFSRAARGAVHGAGVGAGAGLGAAAVGAAGRNMGPGMSTAMTLGGAAAGGLGANALMG